MQPASSRLNRLVDLAKESSSDKRRELLREVTDVFLDSAHDCSDAEKSYFGEIISKVSTGMDVAVRKHLAARLADNPNAFVWPTARTGADWAGIGTGGPIA